MENKNTNENNEKMKSLSKKELREQQRKKKRRMKTVRNVISVFIAFGIFIGILFATGAFDYKPQATYHVSLKLKNYGSLHIELYGDDAPETVDHFLSLVNSDYYNGKTIFKLLDDLVYMGDENASQAQPGVKGEFSDNGFDNKVSHKRGVLSMARGEDADSAYGQFFIVRKNNRKLDGKYAAFGKITLGMEIVDEIYKNLETDANGTIPENLQPIITDISGHASHSH